LPKKLFVGGLSWGTTGETLRSAFERFGAVEDATVLTDRDTGRSRGFGFVTFADAAAADEAMAAMDGVELEGRRIRVNEAQSRGGGGGGGGGGRDRDRPPRRGGR
jgi:RNA recognition motif-containing protein